MILRCAMIGTVLGVGLLAGCRTDAHVRRRPVGGAPLTAFESVELARNSPMALAEQGEVDLVEQVIEHRTQYSVVLKQLRDYYQDHGHAEKYTWAQSELEDIARIRPYHYLYDSDLPRLDLDPSESIPEADALYERAVEAAREAGHGTPALYNQDKMAAALALFKQLIREYPTSDKIDEAAYYCGTLYKEYFRNQDAIAVRWFERAWTWDPATPFDPRFQAAALYDYRLHDRRRALELYRAAVAAEPQHRSNRRWSLERIQQLTERGPVESTRTVPLMPPRAQPDAAVGQEQPPKPPSAAPEIN